MPCRQDSRGVEIGQGIGSFVEVEVNHRCQQALRVEIYP